MKIIIKKMIKCIYLMEPEKNYATKMRKKNLNLNLKPFFVMG